MNLSNTTYCKLIQIYQHPQSENLESQKAFNELPIRIKKLFYGLCNSISETSVPKWNQITISQDLENQKNIQKIIESFVFLTRKEISPEISKQIDIDKEELSQTNSKPILKRKREETFCPSSTIKDNYNLKICTCLTKLSELFGDWDIILEKEIRDWQTKCRTMEPKFREKEISLTIRQFLQNTSATTLDLSYKNIPLFPEFFFLPFTTRLQTLVINGNCFAKIPNLIQLKALTTLIIQDNPFLSEPPIYLASLSRCFVIASKELVQKAILDLYRQNNITFEVSTQDKQRDPEHPSWIKKNEIYYINRKKKENEIIVKGKEKKRKIAIDPNTGQFYARMVTNLGPNFMNKMQGPLQMDAIFSSIKNKTGIVERYFAIITQSKKKDVWQYISYEKLYNRGDLYYALHPTLPPLSIKEKKQITYDLLRALAHVHDLGICFTDIKPSNILIHQNQEKKTCEAAFTDFSDSWASYDYQYPSSKLHIITPRYASLEALKFNVDPNKKIEPDTLKDTLKAADVWSLGLSLYFLFYDKKLPPPLSTPTTPTQKPCQQMIALLHTHIQNNPSSPSLFPSNLPEDSINTLLKGLLMIDPSQRLSASNALTQFEAAFPEMKTENT